MIKLVSVLDRRADVAPADFYDHWLTSYGPRVQRHAAALGARRYVQSHLIDTPANEALRAARGMLPPVAGVGELWWDSLDDVEAALHDPAARAAWEDLAADENTFVDLSGSQVFLTTEHLIFDHTDRRPLGADAVKVAYLLNRRNGLTVEDCHRTWLQDHGPLVASFAELLHTAKYVQSHTTATELNEQLTAGRDFAAPYDGITEVWLESLVEREGGNSEERRRAGTAMAEDERRFVEMGRSRCFMTKEFVIFDHTGHGEAS